MGTITELSLALSGDGAWSHTAEGVQVLPGANLGESCRRDRHPAGEPLQQRARGLTRRLSSYSVVPSAQPAQPTLSLQPCKLLTIKPCDGLQCMSPDV